MQGSIRSVRVTLTFSRAGGLGGHRSAGRGQCAGVALVLWRRRPPLRKMRPRPGKARSQSGRGSPGKRQRCRRVLCSARRLIRPGVCSAPSLDRR